jgi:hypothetical protein
MALPSIKGEIQMCDYSLHTVKTRNAKVDDKLIVHNFGTGTRGFADPTQDMAAGCATAVCVKPGTEIAFDEPIRAIIATFVTVESPTLDHKVAIFRQVSRDEERVHHDALELPDGQIIKLTNLYEGQRAKVLQLPAEPKTPEEAKEQERVAWAG